MFHAIHQLVRFEMFFPGSKGPFGIQVPGVRKFGAVDVVVSPPKMGFQP